MPPVDVFRIAQRLGVPVYKGSVKSEKGEWYDGLVILAKDTGEARILVNGGHLRSQQRFTAAHEICHLIHHESDRRLTGEEIVRLGLGLEGKDLEVTFSDTEIYVRTEHTPWKDVVANIFAVEMLMPEYLLRAWIQDFEFNVEKLAKAFGVNRKAMRIRLEDVFPEFF